MSLPFMRLYPQDYLQDTNHLTTEEHGAYLLLILNYWQTEKPLIDDDKRLAGICRTSVEQWLNIRSTLVQLFNIDNGLWVHKRIESELLLVEKISKQNSIAGKKSAAVRQGKIKKIERAFNHSDSDTDTDTKKEKTSTSSQQAENAPPPKKVPYQKIVALYHEILPNNPKVKVLTPARKAALRQRHLQDMEEDLKTWGEYFGLVGRSAFLTGKTQPVNGKRVFVADLEWITKQSNFAKIYEGKYHG